MNRTLKVYALNPSEEIEGMDGSKETVTLTVSARQIDGPRITLHYDVVKGEAPSIDEELEVEIKMWEP